jgi:hypothetical protein
MERGLINDLPAAAACTDYAQSILDCRRSQMHRSVGRSAEQKDLHQGKLNDDVLQSGYGRRSGVGNRRDD